MLLGEHGRSRRGDPLSMSGCHALSFALALRAALADDAHVSWQVSMHHSTGLCSNATASSRRSWSPSTPPPQGEDSS